MLSQHSMEPLSPHPDKGLLQALTQLCGSQRPGEEVLPQRSYEVVVSGATKHSVFAPGRFLLPATGPWGCIELQWCCTRSQGSPRVHWSNWTAILAARMSWCNSMSGSSIGSREDKHLYYHFIHLFEMSLIPLHLRMGTQYSTSAENNQVVSRLLLSQPQMTMEYQLPPSQGLHSGLAAHAAPLPAHMDVHQNLLCSQQL